MEENDTVEALKQRILQEVGNFWRIVKLTHRLKVLSDEKSLKQEKLESGEVIDVALVFGSAPGPIVDGGEFEFGEVPSYSESQ